MAFHLWRASLALQGRFGGSPNPAEVQMITLRSWKVLGLAVIAIAGGALFLGGPAEKAAANVTGISPSQTTVNSGQNFTVTAVFNTDEAAFTVSGSNYSGINSSNLSFNSATIAPSTSISLSDTNGIQDVFAADPTAGDGGSSAEQLTVVLNVSVDCPSGGTLTFTATQTNSQSTSTVTCLGTTPTATPTVTGTPATATPTVTGTPSAATLTVSVAPTTLSCTGSAFVTVVSKNAAGAVVAGGTVTLSTTLGTISPTTATDTGAGVLAVLTGNGTGGTATITATANGVTGTGTATINCAAATSTPAPPAPTAVPVTTGVQPPRTGDAGLLGDHSTSRTIAGLLLIGLAMTGLAGMAWSRIRS
jgi:hypothetical protein